jgi:hypothetical protein
MCGAIGFHGPPGQEQAYDNTQHYLFLPGQALHVKEISTIRGFLQSSIGTIWRSAQNEIEQFIRAENHLFDRFTIKKGFHFLTRPRNGFDFSL